MKMDKRDALQESPEVETDLSEEQSGKVDLTSLLQVKIISREILRNLDCISLLNIRSASRDCQTAVDYACVWTHVITKDIKWTKMLNILLSKGVITVEPSGSDDRTLFYLNLYHHVLNKLNLLEKNWTEKITFEDVLQLPYEGYVEHVNLAIEWNEKFIVRRINCHAVDLTNRWSLKPEHIFDIGADNDTKTVIKSVGLSNDLMAIGCNRGKVLIWCLNSRKLIVSLADDPTLLANKGFAQSVMASAVECSHVRFNPYGTRLLSCVTNNALQTEMLTLRKVLPTREFFTLASETIHQFSVSQIQIDESYIYILGSNDSGIQIRSETSLEHVRTVGAGYSIKDFKPYNRWVIIAMLNKFSVWDTETGMCVQHFQTNSADGYIEKIGMIGNKFVVSCHVKLYSSDFYLLWINVWDIRRFTGIEENTDPVHSFCISTQSWHERNIHGVRDALVEKLNVLIDDYQIGCLITWEYDFTRREMPIPMLYFINFLNNCL